MQSSQTYSIDLPRPEAGSAGVELPTSVAAEGVDSMPDQPMVVVHTALARRSTRSNEDAVEPVAEAGKKTDGPLPEPDAYQMVRRALRGRYGRAILLGLLGAAAGCAVGWKVGKRHYKAEGLIRIAYSRSMIGFETDQNKPVAMYEAYMRTQQEILESRGILAKSLLDPEWQAIGRDASQDTLEAIAEEVAVQRPAGTEHLLVTVTDDNPVIAAAAVRAIVNTYKTDFNAENEEFEQQRLRVLEEGRQSLQAQLDSVEAKIRSIGGEFVTTNLDSLFDAAAQRAAMLESKLLDVRLSLALAQGAAGTADVPPVTGKPGPAESVSLLTIAQIERVDPTMREYVAAETRAREALDAAREGSYGGKHPEIVRLSGQLERATERVQKWAEEFRQMQAVLAHYPDQTVPGVPAARPQSAAVLQADFGVMSKELEKARRDMAVLGIKRTEMAPYKLQADKLRAEVDRKADRIEALKTELQLGSRLSVINPGEVPLKPATDNRRKFAGAGAFGGAAVPIGLLVLLGLVNRRYRYSDEAATDMTATVSAPLLGIVPALPARLSDPEQSAAAAQCVHQMRVILEVGCPDRKRGAYLVTSPTAGEGKTSLATSLALSYAASGARTLLVDGDIVGRRLTQAFEAGSWPGLRDALARGTVRGYARRTPEGPYLLAAGTADVLDAGVVRSSAVRRLLLDARRYFNVIIIDSGPVLGSVEATAIAPEVDGVIFAVSRGQLPAMAEKALRHLLGVRATIAGFVFNRAEARDFNQSAHASSVRMSVPPEGAARPVFTTGGGRLSRLGPVVDAVAALLPQIREPRALLERAGRASKRTAGEPAVA